MAILYTTNKRNRVTTVERFYVYTQTKMVLTLTLILLTWRIWWAPNNGSRWQMGFNSAFRGLITKSRLVKTNYVV